MVDESISHQRSLSELPAWQETPEIVRRHLLEEPLPLTGQGEQAVYEQFVREVLPYPNGNLGPRFYGWVQGNGMPFAMMADMLAAGMNPHMAGFNQAPRQVEEKVLDWLRQLMEFPEGASGMLTSGGSMASTTGLAVARFAKAGFDIREKGLWSAPQMVVYGSTETHSWAAKAVELLGMGRQSLHLIPTHEDLTIDLEALKQAIHEDRKRGLHPIAVLATAGTVNTGATDDLNAIADLCAQENLWMHVDGAFGALAKLSPKYRHLVGGLERADSVAFDLHKWMYLPFEIACLLVRDGQTHRATFAQEASYISPLDRGTIKGGLNFADHGIELTRSFKALKAWMCLKAYGVEKFGQVIEQNIEQAQLLARLIDDHPHLERLAPAPMNVVCFRHKAQNPDALNKEILYRLQEEGRAVPSSTILNGNFCLRACIVNHRTTFEDIERLVKDVLELGQTLEPRA
jgi:glutamate/tyrosine decarboxylase-like PLP-dependent enzyme